MRFESPQAYRDFWRTHPAFKPPGVSDEDLAAFADHDLVGSPPELRSSVNESAVRADGRELIERGTLADGLEVPATLLRAARGLQDGPDPMVPSASAAEWAAADRGRREVVDVADTNHYTITLGSGAGTVADTIGAHASARR